MWDAERIIIHADLDAFYAAVEERDDPSLVGKPVVIGAKPGTRGVVSTANYAARKFGVGSAMPISQAVANCPQAVFLPVDMPKYVKASQEVFAVFERFSDLVQGVSLDEAYLEVSVQAKEDPLAYAQRLKDAVKSETGLTLSCGVATNKLVAKVASDAKKPDGLVVVEPGNEAKFLALMPVRKLPGIGPKAEERLEELDIYLVGQLQNADVQILERAFSVERATWLKELAFGYDERPVSLPEAPKQISRSTTFQRDLRTDKEVELALRPLCRQVAEDLLDSGYYLRTVSVRVRFVNPYREGMGRTFQEVTRARTLFVPSISKEVVEEMAGELLSRLRANDRRPIRLLGISGDNLIRPTVLQLAFFE